MGQEHRQEKVNSIYLSLSLSLLHTHALLSRRPMIVGSGARQSQPWLPTRLSCSSAVILEKFPKIPKPHFPHLSSGENVPSSEWWWKEMIHGRPWAQGLVQRRVSIDSSHVRCCTPGRCCFVAIVLLSLIIIISNHLSFTSFNLIHEFGWEKTKSVNFFWNVAFPSRKNAGNKLHCDNGPQKSQIFSCHLTVVADIWKHCFRDFGQHEA